MPKRKDVEDQIRFLRNEGETLAEIAKNLNAKGYKTLARGNKISAGYVNYVLSKKDKNKSSGAPTIGSRKDEAPDTIPFRILKSIITDAELSDKQKVTILRSLYKL